MTGDAQIGFAKSLAAALLIVSATAASAEPLQTKLDAFKSFAKEYRVKQSVLSMSYAIVKDGRIVATESFGWQDHDAEEPTTAIPAISPLRSQNVHRRDSAGDDADGIIDLDDDLRP